MWYGYCSNLFGKMRRDANFGNIIVEILRKKKEKGKREKKNDVMVGEREMNFGNAIAEIPAQIFMWEEREQRLRNCNNGVAEIGGERKKEKKLNRNYGNRVAKNWRRGERNN